MSRSSPRSLAGRVALYVAATLIAVTVDRLRAELNSDPRFTTPRDRCTVWHELATWGRGVTRAEYDALVECQAFPFDQYPWG